MKQQKILKDIIDDSYKIHTRLTNNKQSNAFSKLTLTLPCQVLLAIILLLHVMDKIKQYASLSTNYF